MYVLSGITIVLIISSKGGIYYLNLYNLILF